MTTSSNMNFKPSNSVSNSGNMNWNSLNIHSPDKKMANSSKENLYKLENKNVQGNNLKRITHDVREDIKRDNISLKPMQPDNNQITRSINRIDINKKSLLNTTSGLDLDITNYNLTDLFKLFDIKEDVLTEEILKDAKKRVHKLHPDKCKNTIDPLIYEFFKDAYKQLEFIYDVQNKYKVLTNTEVPKEKSSFNFNNIYEEYNDKEKNKIIDKYIKSNGGFNNKNFNEQFEKYYIKSEYETKGYDDWLKSDEGIIKSPEKISPSNMNSYIEEQKKQIKTLVPYKGMTNDIYMGSSAGGTLLDLQNVNNFTGTTSGDIFSNKRLAFTDLKQAHTETLIPVGESEFNNIKKYNNINEYIRERDVSYDIMSMDESLNYFKKKEKEEGLHFLATSYKLEKDLKKAKNSEIGFMSTLKQLTYNANL